MRQNFGRAMEGRLSARMISWMESADMILQQFREFRPSDYIYFENAFMNAYDPQFVISLDALDSKFLYTRFKDKLEPLWSVSKKKPLISKEFLDEWEEYSNFEISSEIRDGDASSTADLSADSLKEEQEVLRGEEKIELKKKTKKKDKKEAGKETNTSIGVFPLILLLLFYHTVILHMCYQYKKCLSESPCISMDDPNNVPEEFKDYLKSPPVAQMCYYCNEVIPIIHVGAHVDSKLHKSTVNLVKCARRRAPSYSSEHLFGLQAIPDRKPTNPNLYYCVICNLEIAKKDVDLHNLSTLHKIHKYKADLLDEVLSFFLAEDDSALIKENNYCFLNNLALTLNNVACQTDIEHNTAAAQTCDIKKEVSTDEKEVCPKKRVIMEDEKLKKQENEVIHTNNHEEGIIVMKDLIEQFKSNKNKIIKNENKEIDIKPEAKWSKKKYELEFIAIPEESNQISTPDPKDTSLTTVPGPSIPPEKVLSRQNHNTDLATILFPEKCPPEPSASPAPLNALPGQLSASLGLSSPSSIPSVKSKIPKALGGTKVWTNKNFNTAIATDFPIKYSLIPSLDPSIQAGEISKKESKSVQNENSILVMTTQGPGRSTPSRESNIASVKCPVFKSSSPSAQLLDSDIEDANNALVKSPSPIAQLSCPTASIKETNLGPVKCPRLQYQITFDQSPYPSVPNLNDASDQSLGTSAPNKETNIAPVKSARKKSDPIVQTSRPSASAKETNITYVQSPGLSVPTKKVNKAFQNENKALAKYSTPTCPAIKFTSPFIPAHVTSAPNEEKLLSKQNKNAALTITNAPKCTSGPPPNRNAPKVEETKPSKRKKNNTNLSNAIKDTKPVKTRKQKKAEKKSMKQTTKLPQEPDFCEACNLSIGKGQYEIHVLKKNHIKKVKARNMRLNSTKYTRPPTIIAPPEEVETKQVIEPEVIKEETQIIVHETKEPENKPVNPKSLDCDTGSTVLSNSVVKAADNLIKKEVNVADIKPESSKINKKVKRNQNKSTKSKEIDNRQQKETNQQKDTNQQKEKTQLIEIIQSRMHSVKKDRSEVKKKIKNLRSHMDLKNNFAPNFRSESFKRTMLSLIKGSYDTGSSKKYLDVEQLNLLDNIIFTKYYKDENFLKFLKFHEQESSEEMQAYCRACKIVVEGRLIGWLKHTYTRQHSDTILVLDGKLSIDAPVHSMKIIANGVLYCLSCKEHVKDNPSEINDHLTKVMHMG